MSNIIYIKEYYSKEEGKKNRFIHKKKKVSTDQVITSYEPDDLYSLNCVIAILRFKNIFFTNIWWVWIPKK